MADERDSTPFYFRKDLDPRERIVLGFQRCGDCGARQLCAWPVSGDLETLAFECSQCGEMAATFEVAYPLEDFATFEVSVRSRRAWLELDPRAPFKES